MKTQKALRIPNKSKWTLPLLVAAPGAVLFLLPQFAPTRQPARTVEDANTMLLGAWRLDANPANVVSPNWKWEDIYMGLPRPDGTRRDRADRKQYGQSAEFQKRHNAVHTSCYSIKVFSSGSRLAQLWGFYRWNTEADRFVADTPPTDLAAEKPRHYHQILGWKSDYFSSSGGYFRVRVTWGTAAERKSAIANANPRSDNSDLFHSLDHVIHMVISPSTLHVREEAIYGKFGRWQTWRRIPLKPPAR